MRSYLAVFLLFFIIFHTLAAQSAPDAAVLNHKKNFVLGNISEKNTVLSAAVKEGGAFASLYVDALRFAAENRALLRDNAELTSLALSALSGLRSLPADNAWLPLLWSVFDSFADDAVRAAVIETLAKGKYAGSETVNRLNAYALSQAALSEDKREKTALLACVRTLGQIANPASFAALFTVLVSSPGEELASASQTALNNIKQDYDKNILAIIEGQYSPVQKLTAFRTAMKNSSISEKSRGEIAEKTLSMAININEGSQDPEAVLALRQESLREIRALHRTQAAAAVINYFILAQKEFKNGKLTSEPFVEIIECLGSMQTADASKVLSGYLAALNSQAELNGSFNEKVVLAVINALGTLGDKSSFDTLLYVSYIQNYPDSVTDAARDALARLKW